MARAVPAFRLIRFIPFVNIFAAIFFMVRFLFQRPAASRIFKTMFTLFLCFMLPAALIGLLGSRLFPGTVIETLCSFTSMYLFALGTCLVFDKNTDKLSK